LPDCVNADTFSPDAHSDTERTMLKRALGLPLDRPLIVYLGLLTEYQGIGLLLQAARHLVARGTDFHVLLMGFPHIGYRARAIEMGLADRVTFTGKVSYEDAPRYLSLGDVAVAPKISATEGSGKILNYMSMALPTVAFEMPVSREYLGADGVYAAETTAAVLAEALECVLTMPETDREQLGRRLRDRAIALYSWQDAGEQMVALYRRLMRRLSGPASAAAHNPGSPSQGGARRTLSAPAAPSGGDQSAETGAPVSSLSADAPPEDE
jgi:glycosyltransferase involved in cell wall biosynthesis